MKDKIEVYILIHETPHVSHASHLSSLFTNRMFNVNFEKISEKTLEKKIVECLKTSWKETRNSHTLILTDRVLSVHNGKYVTEVLKKTLESEFDVAYFFKHSDKCQMHSHVDEFNHTTIVKSHAPKGLEAILFSPFARDCVIGKRSFSSKEKFNYKKGLEKELGKHIYNGNMNCVATSPNIFEYDIMRNSLSHGDYVYRNECAPLQLRAGNAINNNSRTVVILAFILVLIIVTVYALLKTGKC